MIRHAILLRHPPVASAWRGRCYGSSDMGLSREGTTMARAVVTALASEPITTVVHSDMRRTRGIAAAVARAARCPSIADARWRERDFARWEGMTWRAIWRRTGDAMDGMMTDPEGYRPGGGETGMELSERALRAVRDLPCEGLTLVVTHGGPIAAVRTWLAGEPLHRMCDHIPAVGQAIRADLPV